MEEKNLEKNAKNAKGSTGKKKEIIEQPFLLLQGTQQEPLLFYLVIEDTVIPVGKNSQVAFKTLFASFFLFRLRFPSPISFFYKFFSEIVFGIERPTVTSMGIKTLLDHTEMDESPEDPKDSDNHPDDQD